MPTFTQDKAQQSVTSLTGKVASPYNPGSLSAKARERRWELFTEQYPDLREMTVIDLGGDLRAWISRSVRPARLISLNVYAQATSEDWVETVVGDACNLPKRLRGERVDLVFSNSVIEHVGGEQQRRAFAASVHALADRHWVQTPYRYFPIEPHWMFPGFQWLPLRAKAEVGRRWRHGNRYNEDLDGSVKNALSVELLSRTAMRTYFPTSDIRAEKMYGMTKSLIAVR